MRANDYATQISSFCGTKTEHHWTKMSLHQLFFLFTVQIKRPQKNQNLYVLIAMFSVYSIFLSRKERPLAFKYCIFCKFFQYLSLSSTNYLLKHLFTMKFFSPYHELNHGITSLKTNSIFILIRSIEFNWWSHLCQHDECSWIIGMMLNCLGAELGHTTLLLFNVTTRFLSKKNISRNPYIFIQ